MIQPSGTQRASQPRGPTQDHKAKRLLRRIGFVAVGLFLAACVPETDTVALAPPKGVSADRALEEFAITVATADTVGDYCRSFGIRKNFSSTDRLISRYVSELQAQGYSLQQLQSALNRVSVTSAGSKAIQRLEARGVRQNNLASLCRYGRQEIAAGSAIGRLLSISQ